MSQSKGKSKAVALKYQEDVDVAPVVIASGCGHVAEKIIDVAENKGIPVFRDDSAASLMCMLEVGRPIPTELYQVVAVIYGQLMKVSQDIKRYSSEAPSSPRRGGQQQRRRSSNTRREK